MEQYEIEYMPFAPPGRQWWVYAYRCGADGQKLAGGTNTTRLVGQFDSVASALKVYPGALLSEKSQQAVEKQKLAPTSPTISPGPLPRPAANAKKKLLLIDDDIPLLAVMQNALQIGGYEVETLSKSIGATSKILATKPNLVIININMPGLSGPALVGMLRKLFRAESVVVVFYSALEKEKSEHLSNVYGALGYINKGHGINELVSKVEYYLKKSDGIARWRQIDYESLRKYPRLNLEFPIKIIAQDVNGREFQQDVVTVDLSCGGLCFILDRPLTLRSMIKIIHLASKREMTAYVRWVSQEHHRWQIGVEFTTVLKNPILFD